MNRFLTITIFFSFFFFGKNNLLFGQKELPLIPKPVEAEIQKGTFLLSKKNTISVPSNNHEVNEIGNLFAKQLAELTGLELKIQTDNVKNAIVFSLNKSLNQHIGEEGYSLVITSKNIILSANNPAGLFYGAQTLLQMIPPGNAGDCVAIDCVEVTDYPRFEWRGLMLDVSRHFFAKDEVKRFIDQMVKYKYNVFHWHLTDDNGWRIEVKAYPKLTSVGAWSVFRTGWFGSFEPEEQGEPATYGGFYTQEDIREVVKYAADRFVTIVPEVDIPGHSRAVLAAYPEVSCSGNPTTVWAGTRDDMGENVFCVGNEQNFKMLDTIFGEIASLFPGEYIHIGGDEANRSFWEKCPKCQQRVIDEHLHGLPDLQSYFTKRISKILASKGKKLIGWDEILEGGLAPDATVMSWRGMEGAIDAAKSGHKAVMSPTSFCYLDFMQGEKNIERNSVNNLRAKRVYEFEPIPNGIDPEFILGGQGNIWSEFTPNFRRVEYMTWPRALALSEILWSPRGKREWNEFVPRMEAHFPRFKHYEVNYAPSIYDPEIKMIKNNEEEYRIVFNPEIKGLDIYYTFDCTFPDKFSAKYDDKPIALPKGASEIRAISYRGGEPIGRLLVITLEELKSRM